MGKLEEHWGQHEGGAHVKLTFVVDDYRAVRALVEIDADELRRVELSVRDLEAFPKVSTKLFILARLAETLERAPNAPNPEFLSQKARRPKPEPDEPAPAEKRDFPDLDFP